jgi:hypothetical protein
LDEQLAAGGLQPTELQELIPMQANYCFVEAGDCTELVGFSELVANKPYVGTQGPPSDGGFPLMTKRLERRFHICFHVKQKEAHTSSDDRLRKVLHRNDYWISHTTHLPIQSYTFQGRRRSQKGFFYQIDK